MMKCFPLSKHHEALQISQQKEFTHFYQIFGSVDSRAYLPCPTDFYNCPAPARRKILKEFVLKKLIKPEAPLENLHHLTAWNMSETILIALYSSHLLSNIDVMIAEQPNIAGMC